MWEFWLNVRTLVSGFLAPRRVDHGGSASRATDWLPPVLGPEDWSIGLMCDRSAGWFLDRR